MFFRENVPMKMFSFFTSEKSEWHELTSDLGRVLTEEHWNSGILLIFSPHTTGSILLNENCDPDVQRDFLLKMNEIFADDPRFRHIEGNSDAHIKTSLTGASACIPVENGKLMLGTWQGVFFCEWDGPRNRKVFLQFVGS